MTRNRNSFFQEASMSSQFSMPNFQNQFIPQFQAPYQAASATQSYYSGPTINQNDNYYNNFEDYENRLAKLERQINRLDMRITKLENTNKVESIDINNSMYMV